MENPTGTKPNTVVEIASNGDLVLIVGPEETKLRVRSTLLMAASKPFSVMLGPDWKEGHNMHNQHGPFELPLPDDNATALKIVCSIIHHQNEKVPQTLAASDILAIAVVADKYLCMNALKFASETWLRTFGSEPYNLMLLTASAYLFRNAQAFSEITRALVLEYDGSYLALRTDEVESIMPWRIFCKYSKTCLLEEQRGFARLEVSQILIAGGGTSSCCHNSGWTSKYAYAYMKLLETKGLWPGALSHISISKALEKAERMPDPVPEERSTQCQYAYKHEPPAYREHRRWKLDSLNKTIGLCLPCTRLERTDSNCSNPSHNR
ncbi:hypothetical protein IWW34DRAFT_634180 [Fusarium oxysporum f. sp. albedinis]|nr:hypothetical protein IWW34DRAFT_634180 [Fusarium oxysporum f. sp. albedinis]